MALDRRQAVARLLQSRDDTLLVVTGLGSATYDVAAAGDDPRNFYLWGAMGGCVLLALGLALAQPDRSVLAITGDGEMLMGLGGLATVGAQAPDNLAIVVLDNARYGETGMQESHTALGVDLCSLAKGCGIPRIRDLDRAEDLAALAAELSTRTGTLFARLRIAPDDAPRVLPSRDGVFLKTRFRQAVGCSGP